MKRSLQRFWLAFALGAVSLVPCRGLAQSPAPSVPQPQPQPQVNPLYQSAVQDAAKVEPGENVDSLWPITPDNPKLVWNADKTRLLVVTWKSQAAYDRFIKPSTHTSASEAFVVWVTAAPQVKEFCQNYLKKHPHASIADLNQRLKQYLGLHPDWQYDLFVEMWVSPTDLFRPCVNPSITDRQCALTFDASNASKPTVKNIADYPAFYKNLYFQSFRSGPGVPWTGLGYTYDWGNGPDSQKADRRDRTNAIGASEFILVPSASYSLQQAASTQRYCEPIVDGMAGKGD